MYKDSMRKFFNYIKGKRVIIVGPASYLQGKGRGMEIDSYDVVIRVNHAIPIDYPADYGTRTDVLYHAMTITALNKEPHRATQLQFKAWEAADIKWFVSALDEDKPLVRKLTPFLNSVYFKWTTVPEMFYDQVKESIGVKLPSTGVLAIAHLLESEAESLTIVGFDFYNSGIYTNYRGNVEEPTNQWHDADAQKKFMRCLITEKRKKFNLNLDYEFTKAVYGTRKGITNPKRFNFKTIPDLSQDIINNLHKIPHDIDLVIGIPRSGLLAGLMIANYLNVSCIELNAFVDGTTPMCGRYKVKFKKESTKKVLVVDDVIGTGTSFRLAREQLAPFGYKFIYLAVYSHKNKFDHVDIFLEECSNPRAFQWNLFHHPKYKTCWDMDGVICVDPTRDEMNDVRLYEKFLANAKPMIIPTMPIYCIISGRSEQYRKQTERWLKKYNIMYAHLILRDSPQDHAIYKAKNFKAVRGDIFIESNERQAKKIADITEKIVFCVENQQLYIGGT
jgi:hypoxanthine phosphoribosyltransferase